MATKRFGQRTARVGLKRDATNVADALELLDTDQALAAAIIRLHLTAEVRPQPRLCRTSAAAQLTITENERPSVMYCARLTCGARGIRTPDLLIANETRYQLRYSPSYRTPCGAPEHVRA